MTTPLPPSLLPRVNAAACRGCARCLGTYVCPTDAIKKAGRGAPPEIDAELCEGCLACVGACPVGGIQPPVMPPDAPV